jgi:hypothetical protein
MVAFDTPLLVAVAVGTSLTALLIGFLIYLHYHRRRVRVFVTTDALDFMIQEDILSKYKNVYVLSEAGLHHPDLRYEGKIHVVSLTDGELEKSEELKSEYDLPEDVAESVVAARKIKAKKLIVLREISMDLKDKVKPIEVSLAEDET